MARFKIGDKVWVAKNNAKEEFIPCPDCLGKRYLTVTMGDDSQVTIDCVCCRRGYEGPAGVISTYEYQPIVLYVELTSVESELKEDVEVERYGHSGCYREDGENVFATEAEAKVRADIFAKERKAEEEARLLRKEKETRSWAWNAHYHRKCIKQAEKDLAYHASKLNAALPHVKAEKVV